MKKDGTLGNIVLAAPQRLRIVGLLRGEMFFLPAVFVLLPAVAEVAHGQLADRGVEIGFGILRFELERGVVAFQRLLSSAPVSIAHCRD